MLLTSLLPKLTATKMKRVSLSVPTELYEFLLKETERTQETVQETVLRSIKSHANSRFYFIPEPDEDIDCDCMVDGGFLN